MENRQAHESVFCKDRRPAALAVGSSRHLVWRHERTVLAEGWFVRPTGSYK